MRGATIRFFYKYCTFAVLSATVEDASNRPYGVCVATHLTSGDVAIDTLLRADFVQNTPIDRQNLAVHV